MLRLLFIVFLPCFTMARQSALIVPINNNSPIYDSLFLNNDWRVELDSDMIPIFGKSWKSKVASVGESVSNLILGDFFENGKGVLNVNQLKNKLIILDFWHTGCRSCISSFPKMEKLQKEFGDKVQVVLVNCWETEKQISERLERRKLKLPNLFIVIGTPELHAKFPASTIPHHVWIDGNGVVQMIGSPRNTYSEKIEDFLEGKQVSFLRMENTIPRFEPQIPYYSIIKHTYPQKEYFSFFTMFNNNYATHAWGTELNNVDSSKKTIRNTFVNASFWDLLFHAFRIELQVQKISYSPFAENIDLEVKDTLAITSMYIRGPELTDKTYTKSRFCYEQICPLDWPLTRIMDSMRSDLSMLGESLKLRFQLQTDKADVVLLTRSEKGSNHLKLNNLFSSQVSDTFNINSQQYIRYKNLSVNGVIQSTIGYKKIIDEMNATYFIDELNREQETSIVVPINSTTEDYINILKSQGFVLIKEKRNIKTLKVTDKLY